MLLVDIYLLGAGIDWFICTPLGFFLYISYIEKDDPVCGLPSPYISIEKVSSAQGHGNCLYV